MGCRLSEIKSNCTYIVVFGLFVLDEKIDGIFEKPLWLKCLDVHQLESNLRVGFCLVQN